MNRIKKIAALLLACVTMTGAASPAYAYTEKYEMPVSKTQNRSYNFRQDFTLTGNYADDLIK